MSIALIAPDPTFAEWWFKERQDPEAIRFNPMASSTVEKLGERVSLAGWDLAQFEKCNSFIWAVRRGEGYVGSATLQNINRTMQTAEIGYMVSAAARGQGVGSAIVRLIAQNFFAQTPLRKLIAFVHEENLFSRRVLKKTGFQQEGLLREHYIVNGEPANEVIYGLLRKDFFGAAG